MTTAIARSPADVFAVLTDVSKNTDWSKTSVSGQLISPPPVRLGTTAREVSRFMRESLGIDLHPDVLPFSNIPAHLPPFLLRPDRVLSMAT